MPELREIYLKHQAQTSTFPIALEINNAEGCYLFDTSGKKYMDLISGISVSALGHQHPDVINLRRVIEQLKQQRQERANDDTATARVSDDVFNTPLYQELNVLLGESQAELSALDARLAEYRNRRQEMNKTLITLPEVEAQLASLYRVSAETISQWVKRLEC